MVRLAAALPLLLAPAASALSLRDAPAIEDDPWVRGCEARLKENQVDELDYGPCFEPEEEQVGPKSEMMIGKPKTLPSDLVKEVKPQPFDTALTEADDTCDMSSHPRSDTDPVLGHGNPVCRYEPSKEELENYRQNPEDIAIVIPSNWKNDWESMMTDNPDDMYPLNHGVITWHKYAKYHGYAFYSGKPNNTERDCPELEEEKRHPAWYKPCMALQLIKKHKYLIVVDRDTTVLKPRLRLEPLFNMSGLLNKRSGKIFAVAEEWGSCKKGVRCPLSGDVNTGVMLMRGSAATTEALRNWFYGPTRCKDWKAAPDSGARPKGWPYSSPPCRGCACILRGVHKWSYDQVGFYAAVAGNESLKDKVSIFRSGCPINSPFADFIPHLVSGTPTSKVYNINHREPIAKNLQVCSSKLMEVPAGSGDPYARCSLCESLPQNKLQFDSWTESCGKKP